MDFAQQYQEPSKKFTGLTFVVLLHVLIAYIVISSRKPYEPSPPPPVTITKIKSPLVKPLIEEQQIVLNAKVDTTKIYVEPPIIPTGTDPVDGPVDITVVLPPTGPGSGGPVSVDRHMPVYVPPVVNAKGCAEPEYPGAAIQQGLEGTTTLAFLIGVDGRVIGSRLENSSGTKSLDAAALAALSHCRFKPGTIDGVAQQSWTKIQYVWKLD